MAAVDALPYRQAVVGHIGLQEPTQQQPVITILNKQVGGGRSGRCGVGWGGWHNMSAVFQPRSSPHCLAHHPLIHAPHAPQGGRRVVENTDALAALLSERYPLARVQVVDFAARPDITMAEQVQLGHALPGLWVV